MARKRKGVVAAGVALGLLALPAAANAAVTSNVNGGLLTVTSDAGDAITITCVANAVQVNGASPPGGPHACNTITAIDVNGGPGANAITLTGVTTAAFPALAEVDIDGAGGNDTIAGSEIDDVMHGGPDDDRILGDDNAPGTRDEFLGEDGNDTLVWNPGDDDDEMEGGPGADTIEVNGGGGPEQFAVQSSATAGRVVFDRTGPSPTPGPFNLDIGTAERLDMNADGGDDTFDADGVLAGLIALDVDGGEGNDMIDGGDGADLLKGGGGNDRITPDDNPVATRDDAKGDAGDDTMVWNGGDDDDINDGGDGNDTVEVNGAAVGEQFTIKPGAVAGTLRVRPPRPNPPGPFNIDIGTSERLDMNLAGGDDSFVADIGVDDGHGRRGRPTATTRSTAATPPTCSRPASATTGSSATTTRPARATSARRGGRRHDGLEPGRRRRHQRGRRRQRRRRGQRRHRPRGLHDQAGRRARPRLVRPAPGRPRPARSTSTSARRSCCA